MPKTATAVRIAKKSVTVERKTAVARAHKKPIAISAPSQEQIADQPDLHALDLIELRNAVEKAEQGAPAGSDWSVRCALGRKVLVSSFDPAETDECNLQLLAIFQRMARENVSNYATPVNDFICDLVLQHGTRPLTLKDIAEKFQEFEGLWHESFETAHKLYREYRPLVAVGEENGLKLERQEAGERKQIIVELNKAAEDVDVALERLSS